MRVVDVHLRAKRNLARNASILGPVVQNVTFGNVAKKATFLENSTFPFLGNVTFSRNVANFAMFPNVTFYTTGPWSRLLSENIKRYLAAGDKFYGQVAWITLSLCSAIFRYWFPLRVAWFVSSRVAKVHWELNCICGWGLWVGVLLSFPFAATILMPPFPGQQHFLPYPVISRNNPAQTVAVHIGLGWCQHGIWIITIPLFYSFCNHQMDNHNCRLVWLFFQSPKAMRILPLIWSVKPSLWSVHTAQGRDSMAAQII